MFFFESKKFSFFIFFFRFFSSSFRSLFFSFCSHSFQHGRQRGRGQEEEARPSMDQAPSEAALAGSGSTRIEWWPRFDVVGNAIDDDVVIISSARRRLLPAHLLDNTRVSRRRRDGQARGRGAGQGRGEEEEEGV